MTVTLPLMADVPQPVGSPSLDTATYLGVLLTLVAINAFFSSGGVCDRFGQAIAR